MKKLLVMSDNHGVLENVERILEENKGNYDLSIHLGDCQFQERYMRMTFDYYVAGNHDDFRDKELIVDIEGVRVAMLHGHTLGYGLFGNKNNFVSFGKAVGAQLVLHGHTHIADEITEDGVTVVCPGSTDSSRKGYNSYAIITIDGKKIKTEFIEIK